MQTYLVPFKEVETVRVEYQAVVQRPFKNLCQSGKITNTQQMTARQ